MRICFVVIKFQERSAGSIYDDGGRATLRSTWCEWGWTHPGTWRHRGIGILWCACPALPAQESISRVQTNESKTDRATCRVMSGEVCGEFLPWQDLQRISGLAYSRTKWRASSALASWNRHLHGMVIATGPWRDQLRFQRWKGSGTRRMWYWSQSPSRAQAWWPCCGHAWFDG